MYYAIVVGLLCIAVSFEVDAQCPDTCTCSNFYKPNIECQNKGLTVCPTHFPTRSYRM